MDPFSGWHRLRVAARSRPPYPCRSSAGTMKRQDWRTRRCTRLRPEQTMVLTVRRLGEPKYPLQMADFPSWPLVSLVGTDSNRAGCASGAHFKARPSIRLNACSPVYRTGSLVCGCAAAAGCAGVLSVGLLELHPAVRIATLIKLRANAKRYNFTVRSSKIVLNPYPHYLKQVSDPSTLNRANCTAWEP